MRWEPNEEPHVIRDDPDRLYDRDRQDEMEREPLFATLADYQRAVDYIAEYRVLVCEECGTVFHRRKTTGGIPKVCSKPCLMVRRKRQDVARWARSPKEDDK